MKKLILLLITTLLFLSAFTGCNIKDKKSQCGGENNPNMNSSNMQWVNEVALYVDIYFEDSYPISEDIENSFEKY